MQQRKNIYYYFLFLLSPFIAIFFAFKKPKENVSYNIIWLFTAFFGLTFAVQYEGTNDIVRYLSSFNSWKSDSVGLTFLLNNAYNSDQRDTFNDLFFPLISLVAAKLGFSNIFFLGLLGFIFGYFYSRVYKFLALEINFSNNQFFLFFVVAVFLLINPIWRGINGIRFSLGAIIFVYIILRSYQKGFSIVDIIIIISLVFVHFAMLFPIAFFLVFYLFGRRLNIYIVFFLFLFSFFISTISLDGLNELLKNYLPEFLNPKVDAYASDTYAEDLQTKGSAKNWYAQIFLKVLFYSCSIMIFYIFRKYKELINYNEKLSFLVKFSISFSAIVNIFNFIPSFGRMDLISNTLVVFIFGLLISNIAKNDKWYLPLKIILIPMLSFYIMVQMRIGFDYISLETIIGNPFLALFNIDKIPLIDFIK